jgi:hypothetical protein
MERKALVIDLSWKGLSTTHIHDIVLQLSFLW